MSSRVPLRHALVVLGLITSGCFDDPKSTETTSTETDTSTGTGESMETEGTSETGGPTDDSTDTDTSGTDTTGDPVCDTAGCACVGVEDCADGLDCLDDKCTQPVCGDNILSGDEQCDDANLVNGDGCDNDCTYTQILAVEAGGASNCVLIEGGRVRCWGLGAQGALGLGSLENIGDDELPNSVSDVELPAPATQIAVSDGSYACALLEDSSVHCWGANPAGQLGYGNTMNSLTPGPAVTVGAPVEHIAAGGNHTCVRTASDTVRCWGAGAFGRLGYANTATVGDDELPNTVGDVSVGGPASVLIAGGAQTCILSLVGTVRCWGNGQFGQLGYGNPSNIGDDETPASVGDAPIIPKGLGPFSKATVISTSVAHTCVVFETGEALCWGDGSYGQLGQSSTDSLGDDETPSTASPLEFPDDAVSITACGAHSCVLLDHGDVYCWGSNVFGQLGYGNTDSIGDDELAAAGGPVDLGGASVQVDAGMFHTCALTEKNEVRCWGNNDGGQLGLGHTNKVGDDELPIEVPPVAIF